MEFYKYHGTGNDFVMIDNRNLAFEKNSETIEKICRRRFGVGADGLILLENDNSADFRMVYYNSDGKESTMCGNGGRCIVAFANFLGIFYEKTKFTAIDGTHFAKIKNGIIKLKMLDVTDIKSTDNDFELFTGSPHFVRYIDDIESYDVLKKGREIRTSKKYNVNGINVNFVREISENEIFVRTYERGVENETYSCGTGVTAAALTFMLKKSGISKVKVKTRGGDLKVYAEKFENSFKNIWLKGSATQVFKGNMDF